MLSFAPAAAVLGLVAAAALALVLARRSPPGLAAQRRRAARALAIAIAVQVAHLTEETVTGFHERLGDPFELPDIPLPAFLGFNLAWLAAWIASVPGVRRALPIALFAAWFLALAGIANGILHPLLAVAEGGYFPGLISAPVVGAAGLWLGLRLRDATEPGRLPER